MEIWCASGLVADWFAAVIKTGKIHVFNVKHGELTGNGKDVCAKE